MKRFFAALWLLGAVLLCAPPMIAHAQDSARESAKEEKSATAPKARVIEIKGVISPATFDQVQRELKAAADGKADVIVLEMHTPGGLYDSTQQIIQRIIDSEVPVVTYVYPPGSHAASAGTYILYASHIAAMAPSTNLGAATPIQLQQQSGEKKKEQSTLESKMVNDAAAYIRGLAELRGRNAEWAERAVREAESLTASEALSKKVIDVMADDVDHLLSKIDGREVKMAHGKKMTLKTKGAEIERVVPDWRHKLLEVITHPNVALLLMSLGSYGLVYEFANPGALFPGILGAIFLLLGLFAMNVLPINYSGLALVFLGMGLMVAEAFTPAFGLLGLGGAAAFIFGAVMLFNSEAGFGVDWWMIGAMTGMSLGFLTLLLGLVAKSHRKKAVTGQEEILSTPAEVIHWSGNKGEVRMTGEVWLAESTGEFILMPGDAVKVIAIDGLVLRVVPLV